MSELDKILKKAEKEHDILKHPYVGTEHLLLSLLSYDNDLTDSLKKYNLTYNKFKRKLKEVIGEGSSKSPYVLYTPMLRKVLSYVDCESNNINVDLFNAIIKANEGIAIRIMESMNIDIDKIKIYSYDYMQVEEDFKVTQRDKEINEIFQILMRKNKCNPLLIGEAGVGKTAIVEEIQRRLKNNKVPKILNGYNIINIDISSIVAGTKYRGDFESKINDILKRYQNSNNILFIDEIHTLVNAGGAEGAISAGDIIKPYLARGLIKCIGATTLKEYHKYFEVDEALNRRFQTIMINEPSNKATINILNNIKNNYEKFHNLKISKELISEIVNVSSKYILNRYNPDKSIELLDSCCTNAKFFEQDTVDISNLYNVFECRYGIDLSDKYIKDILDNKKIVYKDLDIDNCNIIYINGNEYKNEEDIYNILGNPYIKNSNYLLKSAIDIPVGLIKIINYNYNKILKEFINNLLYNRKLMDNYGNIINLNNYIIVMDNINNELTMGFNDIKVSNM